MKHHEAGKIGSTFRAKGRKASRYTMFETKASGDELKPPRLLSTNYNGRRLAAYMATTRPASGDGSTSVS